MPESPTVVAEGTQVAIVGTEQTLTDQVSVSRTFVVVVDTSALMSGDILALKIYTKARFTSVLNVAYYATFSGAQAQPNKYSVPVPADIEMKATLEQTAGTARSFDWKVLAL